MATYGGGASIKESGSLKRTTNGTTSKTLGANEYALVSVVITASVRVEGISSGSTAYEDQDAATQTHATMAGMSHNQFVVGGGVTFSVVRGSTNELQIDGITVFKFTGTTSISAQYVIFE
tara:strand:+ start:12610 stop:12969 length:360 start_codon:yes stop_codon:yes gene_type:complete